MKRAIYNSLPGAMLRGLRISLCAAKRGRLTSWCGNDGCYMACKHGPCLRGSSYGQVSSINNKKYLTHKIGHGWYCDDQTRKHVKIWYLLHDTTCLHSAMATVSCGEADCLKQNVAATTRLAAYY